LGEYLAIDPIVIRLFFVVLTLADGIGFMLYLVLWLVIPQADATEVEFEDRVRSGAGEISERAQEIGTELRQAAVERNPRVLNWIGGTLVVLGAYFLLRNLNLSWLAWMRADLLWPLLLVGAGVFLIIRRGSMSNE
jgi:phage shock protein C